MKYIDSHAHYLARQFNSDREVLLKELFNNDLDYIIECGTNSRSNARITKFVENHDKVYGVIGFFPTDVKECENEGTIAKLKGQLALPKILGIGEIGLDYYHPGDKKLQKKWFIEQLKIAKELNLPVCIHSRDAEADTVAILKNNGEMNGVIHCFSYGTKAMEIAARLGYYFGVGGTVTYKNNKDLREAVKNMPLERIVLETDAPYLTPEPDRRARNDSSKILIVIDEIAKLKKVSREQVIEQTNKNVFELYPKLKSANN